tara:strand:+ start:165 stop:677 length:513 start_codon:yes stop_codon:yes gene_type:complete
MTDTKSTTKKVTPSKVTSTLKQAMLEFQRLAVSASKDSTNPHFKSSYSSLEAVIKAVNQGNQFGLFFTQEMCADYISNENEPDVIQPKVKTTVHHVNDKETFVSELPIILQAASMQNPQKMGAAITYYKRYTLQSVYGLPSEDDDGNLASKPSIKTSNAMSSQGAYDDGL